MIAQTTCLQASSAFATDHFVNSPTSANVRCSPVGCVKLNAGKGPAEAEHKCQKLRALMRHRITSARMQQPFKYALLMDYAADKRQRFTL